MMTKGWKVFGADGHRQRESFFKSYAYDFSNDTDGARLITVLNSDVTGTHDYSIVFITRDTEKAVDKEFKGQLSDGIFENSAVGMVEQINFERN